MDEVKTFPVPLLESDVILRDTTSLKDVCDFDYRPRSGR